MTTDNLHTEDIQDHPVTNMKNQSRTKLIENLKSGFNSFLLFSTSFIFGFCMTVLFHEFGHVLMNKIYGVPFIIYYHPFGRSAVVSSLSDAGLSDLQILSVYITGPLFDIFCSTLIASFFWTVRKQKYIPILMWNSLSLFGQGIGLMLDS